MSRISGPGVRKRGSPLPQLRVERDGEGSPRNVRQDRRTQAALCYPFCWRLRSSSLKQSSRFELMMGWDALQPALLMSFKSYLAIRTGDMALVRPSLNPIKNLISSCCEGNQEPGPWFRGCYTMGFDGRCI